MLAAIILIVNSTIIYSQNLSGTVLNKKNNQPIEYVNIGLAGKNIGTVSDFNGKFNLMIDAQYDSDTLLFSVIGYAPYAVKVAEYKKQENKNVYLTEKVYQMNEITIKPKTIIQKTLGVKTESRFINAGFKDNLLGYECGILMNVKKTAYLKTININIAQCTFDSILYRVNIYKVTGKMKFGNILKNSIYLRLPKAKIKDKITIDLTPENLTVDGDFLVTLENIKDLGAGASLYFCAGLSGTTYFRKTSQAEWQTTPVGISISVEADVEK